MKEPSCDFVDNWPDDWYNDTSLTYNMYVDVSSTILVDSVDWNICLGNGDVEGEVTVSYEGELLIQRDIEPHSPIAHSMIPSVA